MQAAALIAENIRLKVETARIPTVEEKITAATVSIEVASLVPSPEITVEEFIALADGNLYLAKEKGRNQVYCYGDRTIG